jgi:hypothetical protein
MVITLVQSCGAENDLHQYAHASDGMPFGHSTFHAVAGQHLLPMVSKARPIRAGATLFELWLHLGRADSTVSRIRFALARKVEVSQEDGSQPEKIQRELVPTQTQGLTCTDPHGIKRWLGSVLPKTLYISVLEDGFELFQVENLQTGFIKIGNKLNCLRLRLVISAMPVTVNWYNS